MAEYPFRFGDQFAQPDNPSSSNAPNQPQKCKKEWKLFGIGPRQTSQVKFRCDMNHEANCVYFVSNCIPLRVYFSHTKVGDYPQDCTIAYAWGAVRGGAGSQLLCLFPKSLPGACNSAALRRVTQSQFGRKKINKTITRYSRKEKGRKKRTPREITRHINGRAVTRR
jgi:hypothetical protein